MVDTATPSELDETRAEEFAGRLFELFTGGILTFMVDIGARTGLFEAAAVGPATSEELAARAGLEERYVREWLGAMATGGIVEFEAATRTFRLPPEHAVSLTGGGSGNLARFGQINAHLGKHLPEVARAFREGGGVPYAEFRPEFTDLMDGISRNGFDEDLVAHTLPIAPGLPELLTGGARVADIGCGTGHSTVVLARAFPASSFVGYDIAEDAIAQARAEASEAGVDNARFEIADAASLTVAEPFDAAVSFDTIHDQVDPAGVLASIQTVLKPGGIYLMVEPRVSSNLEDNVGNPLAPLLYGISTLHCMTVSLAGGGAGLGTAWGEQLAFEMLADAGFVDVSVHDAPADPLDGVYIARKPAAL